MNPQNQPNPETSSPAAPAGSSPAPQPTQSPSGAVQVPVNIMPAVPAQQISVPQPAEPPVVASPVNPPGSVIPVQNPVQQQVPIASPAAAPTPVPTVQQPVPNPVTPAQPTGFTPSGFQQANFIQQGFQPGDIKPSKKGLANNKLFILIVALVAFTLVIGGWFAYSRLWVVNRTPSLISFSNANRALYKSIGGVTERQYTNLSYVSDDYSADIDKTRNEKLQTVFEKLDELTEKHESEASKFKSVRDPEFAKLVTDFSADIKKCSGYVKNLSTDINTFGPVLDSLRKAGEPISIDSNFKDSSTSNKKKIISTVKSDYSDVVNSLKKLDLKTEQVKKIRDGFVEKIEAVPFDDLLADLDDPASADFVPVYKATDLYDANKKGMTEISHELDKGICHSDAREELNEIFKEHEFNEEDKDLLESVELF